MSDDPYLDDEGSTEDSEPEEAIQIELPTVTYRLACGERDVEIGGFTFTASTVTRTEEKVATSTSQESMEVWIPLAHPVAQRYLQNGIPPQQIVVTVFRKQVRSGLTEIRWRGEVEAMDVEDDGTIAKLQVPSVLAAALRRRLPVITVGRSCPHMLYDENCRADPSSFVIIARAVHVDGPFVTLEFDGGHPDHWAQFGKLVHVASGESMPINDQVGTLVTMQLQIAELATNDIVHVFAGCERSIQICDTKFSNRHNFGGFNLLPRGNPFRRTGLGIYSSE